MGRAGLSPLVEIQYQKLLHQDGLIRQEHREELKVQSAVFP